MPYITDSKGRQHHVSMFGTFKKEPKPASGYGTPVTPAASRGVSLADSRQGSSTHTKPCPASARGGSQQVVSVRPSTSHSQYFSPSGRSRAGTVVPSQRTARPMESNREDYPAGSYYPSARQSMREADASGHSARPSRSMTATNPNASGCYHESSAYASTAYDSSVYPSSAYESSSYGSSYGQSHSSYGDNQLDYYRGKAMDAARKPEAVSIWKAETRGGTKYEGMTFHTPQAYRR